MKDMSAQDIFERGIGLWKSQGKVFIGSLDLSEILLIKHSDVVDIVESLRIHYSYMSHIYNGLKTKKGTIYNLDFETVGLIIYRLRNLYCLGMGGYQLPIEQRPAA